MHAPNVLRTFALCVLAWSGMTGPALADPGLGPIRFDNWGFFQKNPDGTNQWQYRPRVYVPYEFESGWTFRQRADVPMIYTDSSGAGNPGGGYSGGIGNILLESILDTPDVAPNLSLRASVRLVFPSPKPSPFGKDNQYQVAPMIGLSYRIPDVLRGVTLAPSARYFWGFNANEPNVTLVNTLDLYPAVDFRLDEQWVLQFYPENPITYNQNSRAWFVPLDFMFVRRVSETFEFGIGGAFKLGNPSSPSYDYLLNGRATFHF
jgi:hypothetical protein